jgi:23S rRNA (guanosine2251-2'-O)-methyltransferase
MIVGVFITIYGRMPVLEALLDEAVRVEKVLLARTARGASVDEIVAAARRRSVRVQKVAPEKVTRVSGNGRHDQGVVADVEAPGLRELDDEIDAFRSDGRSGRGVRLALLVLDGVTNPANVGMIIRTATGAGLDGVVLPRAGSPDVGPLVVKASAGVAFRSRIYRAPTAAAAVGLLRGAGVEVVGLRGDSAASLFGAELGERVAFVLGNETDGVSVDCDRWLSIPMHAGVDSLNVAVAAGIVSYEIARRR